MIDLNKVLRRIKEDTKIALSCDFENADFMAKEIIKSLDVKNIPIYFSCFWNKIFFENGIEVTPIIKKYEEILPADIDILIIVKSIDDNVFRTNLIYLLGKIDPKYIFVVTDSISTNSLKEILPKTICDRIEFVLVKKLITCDSDLTPLIVKTRRQQYLDNSN